MSNLRTFFDIDGDMDWIVVSTNTNVFNNKGYIVDTSSGSVTITLPISPVVGDVIGIKDIASNFGTNNLIINRNGKLIDGLDSNKTISLSGYCTDLTYSGAVQGWVTGNETYDDIPLHIASTSNPHSVTKAQVGLGNVNNTSDAEKPVSTATSDALALKANLASPTFTGVPAAPTPLSTDDSTAIATTAFVKDQGYVTSSGVTSVSGTAPITSSGGDTPAIGISAATTSAAGSMSSTDKTKLNGIAAGAQVNVATNLTTARDGGEVYIYSSTGTDITLLAAATTVAGVMTSLDKTKLNGIETGATADMTANEILTAIKTVDGTTSGLDADLLDGVDSTAFFRNDISNTSSLLFFGTNGRGIGYWGSQSSYGTWMSAATDVTWGGRITGDTTSDYNIYSRISGGTNRGFVFETSYGSKIMSVNPTAVIIGPTTLISGNVGIGTLIPAQKLDVAGKVTALNGYNTGSFDMVYNSTTQSLDFNFIG